MRLWEGSAEKEQPLQYIIPSLYPGQPCECWRGVRGYESYMETGENRVNMDLSWPLKARKATGQCVLDYYWSLATNCPSKYTATGTRPDLQLKTATKWTECRLHLQHVQYYNAMQGSWMPDLDYLFFIKYLETEEATDRCNIERRTFHILVSKICSALMVPSKMSTSTLLINSAIWTGHTELIIILIGFLQLSFQHLAPPAHSYLSTVFSSTKTRPSRILGNLFFFLNKQRTPGNLNRSYLLCVTSASAGPSY